VFFSSGDDVVFGGGVVSLVFSFVNEGGMEDRIAGVTGEGVVGVFSRLLSRGGESNCGGGIFSRARRVFGRRRKFVWEVLSVSGEQASFCLFLCFCLMDGGFGCLLVGVWTSSSGKRELLPSGGLWDLGESSNASMNAS